MPRTAGSHPVASSVPADDPLGRSLASRWVATLDERPFRPTPEQLAWVAGSDLVEGEAGVRRRPIAAGRYAALFADHVAQDVTVDGGAAAYVRIWLCARRAFIDNVNTRSIEAPSDPGTLRWEDEGGASL